MSNFGDAPIKAEGQWVKYDNNAPDPTPEEIASQKETEHEQLRAEAYRNESDPLFFKYQRGEVEKQVWLDKVTEIKARYS